jgi:hypothetical protein
VLTRANILPELDEAWADPAIASLYDAFASQEAGHILRRLEFHFTPNMPVG